MASAPNVGRNDPCSCGSGKKFKKCCIDKDRPVALAAPRRRIARTLSRALHAADRETLAVQTSRRPIIAAEFKGHRFRAVGSRVYPRPLPETFHEFLWHHLKWQLGEEWYVSQVKQPQGERHQVVQWYYDLFEWQKKHGAPPNADGVPRGALPSGDVQSLLSLAYDVYTLAHAMSLPDSLMERLRDQHEFQGARYEIAVAAIFVRAEFQLEFLKDEGKKRCEFIATHKKTDRKVGVEAKSRRRRGVLHEGGALDPEGVLRGDVQQLFDTAIQQKPDGLPFIIFIDLNCPPTSGAGPTDKAWWDDLRAVFDTHDAIKEGKADQADAFSAVVITNFSSHYSGEESFAVVGERILIKPSKPKDLLPDEDLFAVWQGVERYGGFPRDPKPAVHRVGREDEHVEDEDP